MGRAAKNNAKRSAKLTEAEFHHLVRAIQEVELVQMRAQQAMATAVDRRDAVYKPIAVKYGFSESLTQVSWDEDTFEVTVGA